MSSLDSIEYLLKRVLIIGLALLALMLVGVYFANKQRQKFLAEIAAQKQQLAGKGVQVVIETGDGLSRTYSGLKFAPEMSALDALRLAGSHALGPKLVITGEGETGFVSEIDGLKNAGVAQKDSKNWQFWVNGTYGSRGAGVTKLNEGDVVRWSYEPFVNR